MLNKIKVTIKEMKNTYSHILSIGYCDAQYLLRFIEPIAYSISAEGWACDYYLVDGVLISTGYAPIDDKNMKHNYDVCSKFENMACTIANDYALSYEHQKNQINNLLSDYIKSCKI